MSVYGDVRPEGISHCPGLLFRGDKTMNAGPEDLLDLGWHNAGGEVAAKIDEAIKKCREAKHHAMDIDLSNYRGLDHLVSCLACGYKYHYDSSD
jgi:hypothetical protein